MFPHWLKVYFPNSNLHKVIEEILITDIDNNNRVMSVLTAISKNIIKNDWALSYNPP